MASASTTIARWPDLPTDLLHDVSGRLHDAVDLVRFHAVCKPWHDAFSAPPSCRILPWLLGQCDTDDTYGIHVRPVLSGSGAGAAGWSTPGILDSNWLVSADGSGARVLRTTVGLDGEVRDPCIVNPLTGEATSLPAFPREIGVWVDEADGIVAGDGTVVLHRLGDVAREEFFAVAVLRPGEAEWAHARKVLGGWESAWDGIYTAAYHDGKVVVFMGKDAWFVAAADGSGAPAFQRMALPPVPHGQTRKRSYVVESRGELLCASVLTTGEHDGAPRRRDDELAYMASTSSVTVHALEPAPNSEATAMRWVRRDEDDGGSMAGRALFLGNPSSFAADADADDDGCAYFVQGDKYLCTSPLRVAVFRHSFAAGATTVAHKLPTGWHEGRCTWFVPQPAIAPVSAASSDPRRRRRILLERNPVRLGPWRELYVGNLTPVPARLLDVRLIRRLDQLLSQHGKVKDVRVARCTKTFGSQGFAFVTMATSEGLPLHDLIANIDGQILDGRAMRVRVAEEGEEDRLKSHEENYIPKRKEDELYHERYSGALGMDSLAMACKGSEVHVLLKILVVAVTGVVITGVLRFVSSKG